MNRTPNILRLALSAGLVPALPACSLTGDDYGKARFVLIPDGGGTFAFYEDELPDL